MSSDKRKLSLRQDWPTIPYLIIILSGIAVSVYDFIFLQSLRIQLSLENITGVVLMIMGGALRAVSRLTLRGAGFSVVNSARLRIVEKQRLITEGVYGYIRHPLYLGEIVRNMGFALAASSLYGLILMLLGNLMLLFRIRIEEKMMVEEFGAEYTEYMLRTKKFIPYIY